MPAFPAITEPLSDGTVSLRASSERDIPEILIAYEDDPEMYLRLGDQAPPTGAELGSAYESHEAERLEGSCMRLTITTDGDDRCRGRITVHNVRWDGRRAELGIWVAPQLRGRGVARRALRLSAAWLFDDCGIERLALLTEPDNEPMLASAAAAGFVREGLLRSYGYEQGRRVDLVLMSLLPSDLS